MTTAHPDIEFITEYVSGSLPLAQAACLFIHVNHCQRCQRIAGQLTDLGAKLFTALEPVPVGDTHLNSVMARLDNDKPLTYVNRKSNISDTPAILQRLMRGDFSDLKWQHIGISLRVSHLRTGDPNHEFALYHMRAGGRIPRHDHRGTEMTLVLKGGFSDTNGSFEKGDFLVCQPGEVHRPTALQSEDCICLVVLSAPLKFTDWKFRWINPFLKLRAG